MEGEGGVVDGAVRVLTLDIGGYENGLFMFRCFALLVALSIAFSAMGREPVSEQYGMVLEVVDKEVMDQIASDLEREEILFERENDVTIWYSVADYRRFNEIAGYAIKNDLPAGRSMFLPEGGDFKLLISGFEHADIGYVVKYRRGQSWIVWEAEKVSEGRAIVDAVVAKVRQEFRR